MGRFELWSLVLSLCQEYFYTANDVLFINGSVTNLFLVYCFDPLVYFGIQFDKYEMKALDYVEYGDIIGISGILYSAESMSIIV